MAIEHHSSEQNLSSNDTDWILKSYAASVYDHKIYLIPYVQVGNGVLLKGNSSGGSTSHRLFIFDNPLQYGRHYNS